METGLAVRLAHTTCVLGSVNATFRNEHHIGRDHPSQPFRQTEVDLEGAQVAIVDADHLSACLHRDVHLVLVVHLDQRRDTPTQRYAQQLGQALLIEGGDDEQHGVGAGRPRLPHLVGIGDEVLAKDREVGRKPRGLDVLRPAAEARHVSEHRDGGGTALRVDARQLSGPVILRQDPHAGGPLLHLRDDGEARSPQRADEVLRRVRVYRPLEVILRDQGSPSLHVLPGLGDEAGQDVFWEAHSCEIVAQRWRTSPARPESIASAPALSPCFQSFASPAARSAAAVLRRTTSRRGPGAPSRTSRAMRAFSSGPPPRMASVDAEARPSSAGSSSYSLRRPSISITWDGPLTDSSSMPSPPWNTIARSTPSRMRTSAILPATVPSATPRAWYRAPAGLQRGPRTLNTVRSPSSRRGTAAKRKDGWKIGANRNPMPAVSMQRATPSGARSIFTPSCSSTSADPHMDDAARLPCLATRAPQAAATIADRVEMLKVERPSPPVPQVSRRSPSTVIGVAIARAVRANPVISSTVSPFMRRAMTNPAIWVGVASPRMIPSKAADASASESDSQRTNFAIASTKQSPSPLCV